MKTKYIFSTFALAALMAACSNEDFGQVQNEVQQPENEALAGRNVGNVVLNAGRLGLEDGVESRIEGSISGSTGSTSIAWNWSGATDKLGGVVVDYAQGGKIVEMSKYPNYVITNYPFEPKIEGPSPLADFSCPSAVVEGAYIFYSQYKGSNTKRGTISDEIERVQMVKYGREAGLKQIGSNETEGGENFFISPIVEVEVADESDIATRLALTSAHSILHFTLQSDLESKYYGENGLKINKIVVQTTNGANDFKLQNTIDPASLNAIQKAVYDANPLAPWRAAFTKTSIGNYAIEGSSVYAKEAQDAVLAYMTDVTATTVPVIGKQDPSKVTNDLVYQLKTPYTFVNKDGKMELFVIMPTGTFKNKTGLPIYNGKTEGALRVTVYTSEGTYDEYIGNGDDITAHRNEKINITRTLKIKGDETNINLYDPNKGFNIESTEDYEFTIDYIKNHFRDFGNSSDWKAPILNFVDGVTIDVNEGYYFPDFRVKYTGNATLNLNVADGSEYVFDPTKAIFDATKTPTLKIQDATSSITFNEAIPAAEGTSHVELISAGQVNVNANIVFTELESTNELNVADEVVVEVQDLNAVIDGLLNLGASAELNAQGYVASEADIVLAENSEVAVAGDFATEGDIEMNAASTITVTGNYNSHVGSTTLAENAVLTVNGKLDNSANITINATALVDLKDEATNDGEIIVKGQAQLKAAKAFTNEIGGAITVEDYAVSGMDDDSRGIATFATLNNNAGATITIEDGSDNKGTYGGLVQVSTALNNAGEISVNGELMSAKKTTNSGTITLQDNAYARIVLRTAASLTNAQGEGSVVISTPAVYEMFDSFFTGRNELSIATGVIEAELDQDTYNKVMANYAKYDAVQETAWEVLNKITVKEALEIDNVLTEGKDFVLTANASLISMKNALTINSLTAEGASTSLDKVSTLAAATINVKKNMNIEAGASFEVATGVKAILPANTANDVLNIAGLLTNKGALNATGSLAAINTSVSTTGELINLGTIGTKASGNKYLSGSKLNALNAINEAYNKFAFNWYVRVVNKPLASVTTSDWSTASQLTGNSLKWDIFKAFVNATLVDDQFEYAGKTYKVYVTNGPWTVPTIASEVKSNINNTFVDYDNNNLINKGSNGSAKVYAAKEVITTLGSIQDYIAIEVNNGIVDLQDVDSKAYGYIKDNVGTKKGEFTEDYKNAI